VIPGLTNDSDVLFSGETLPVFELTLSDEAISDLRREPYEYTEATLTFEGIEYGPIGIRTKGENSWRPFSQKSSLKLDFNRYEGGPDRFLGMKGLTFQAMNEDASMMHERVAYRMYREAGVPAVRATHALIYVNGELYGLFTMLDSVDDIWLKRWFEDNTGPMWEQHDADLTPEYVDSLAGFQHENGEDDRTSLRALADALVESGPEAVAAAGEVLDWAAFHRYWAVGGLVMQFDAYPFRFAGDDCHLYFDPTAARLIYIPHGVDESFYYDENFETRAAGHLSARCREVPECRDAWAAVVYDSLEIMESIDLQGYAEEVRDQIEPWAEADPARNYTMGQVRTYQQDMIDKIGARRARVESILGPDPGAG
jgi:spore coat protein CotH